jgi:hypothetical protein
VKGAVTALHPIVEGTPYWFVAKPAINFLLIVFFQLFSVYQVVRRSFIMNAGLHLAEDLSHTHTLCLLHVLVKAHNREGEGEVVRIERACKIKMIGVAGGSQLKNVLMKLLKGIWAMKKPESIVIFLRSVPIV